MLVRFMHPRKLSSKAFPRGSQLFLKGVHEVPDALKDDWFFKAQLQDGSLAMQAKEEQVAAPKAAASPAKSQPQGK